jgi:hypothetical protein
MRSTNPVADRALGSSYLKDLNLAYPMTDAHGTFRFTPSDRGGNGEGDPRPRHGEVTGF